MAISFGLTADPATEPDRPELLPRGFGDFELLEEIARGGMGVVYRARQKSLNRIVALKMILSGPFASPAAIGRFRTEARIVASLQHPNIVAIHEVGEAENQPYFTMDFIVGGSLTELIRDGPLAPERAARYVAQIALAVQHAHEQGVLHRDLKPSNVLIDAFDQPRVTDFGLARQVSADSEFTITGQMIGSPAYMAPEQISGRRGDIGPRTDIYSLGAILYHLLTGRPPFATGTMAETFQQVLADDPLEPRVLNPAIPVDLQTVCVKCLEKDMQARYTDASSMAVDLERFLNGRPVFARPIGRFELAWRWCRRRPLVAALTGAVALLAVTLLVASWFATWRIELARRAETREAKQVAQANSALANANARLSRSLSIMELQRAEESFRSGDAGAGLAELAGILRREPTNYVAAERLLSALVYRNLALPDGPPLRHPGKVFHVEYSPDGRWILTVCWDGAARIWNVQTRRQVAGLRDDQKVISACFSPDGEGVLTGSNDGVARLRKWNTAENIIPELKHGAMIGAVAFSPDGSLIATGGDDRTARIWSAQTGRLVATTAAGVGPVLLVTFSPDGTTLLTTSPDYVVRGWNARTGVATGLEIRHQSWVTAMEFTPDGQQLITASRDHSLATWDARTGLPVAMPLIHPDGLNGVACNADGRLLVTSCMDNCARVWDLGSHRLRVQAMRHVEQVSTADFDPNGGSLATACLDGNVYFWDLRSSAALTVPMHQTGGARSIEFSPDSRLIAVACDNGTVRIWDRKTKQQAAPDIRHAAVVQSVCFSPDGRLLVTASADCLAQVWDVNSGKPVAGPFRHGAGLWSARFSADGTRVLTASADHTARVWAIDRTNAPLFSLSHDGEVYLADFSPDGSRIITASADGSAKIWDSATGQLVAGPLAHIDRVVWAEFSPSGQSVATASADNTARIWDANSGKLQAPPLLHARTIQTIHFSPDGRRVVTASLDHTARIWSTQTGEPLAPPLQHDDEVLQACFSPDGRFVATAAANGTVRLWDADSGLPVSEPLPANDVRVVSFSPDGHWLVAGSAQPDDAVRVWRVLSVDRPVPEWLPTLAEVVAGLSVGPHATFQEGPRTTLAELARQIGESRGQDDCTRAARWFMADRLSRPISPYGEITLPTYVRQRINEKTRPSLEEAIRLEPTNAVALAELANLRLKAGAPADAELLARRALQFDSTEKEARDVLKSPQATTLSDNKRPE